MRSTLAWSGRAASYSTTTTAQTRLQCSLNRSSIELLAILRDKFVECRTVALANVTFQFTDGEAAGRRPGASYPASADAAARLGAANHLANARGIIDQTGRIGGGDEFLVLLRVHQVDEGLHR